MHCFTSRPHCLPEQTAFGEHQKRIYYIFVTIQNKFTETIISILYQFLGFLFALRLTDF